MSEAWVDLGAAKAGGVLLIGDHASNHVPSDIELGIDPALLGEHIAVDIGVAEVAALLVALTATVGPRAPRDQGDHREDHHDGGDGDDDPDPGIHQASPSCGPRSAPGGACVSRTLPCPCYRRNRAGARRALPTEPPRMVADGSARPG